MPGEIDIPVGITNTTADDFMSSFEDDVVIVDSPEATPVPPPPTPIPAPVQPEPIKADATPAPVVTETPAATPPLQGEEPKPVEAAPPTVAPEVQLFENVIGKPLTADSLQELLDNSSRMDEMADRLLSSDPTRQGEFLDNLVTACVEAQRNGEVSHAALSVFEGLPERLADADVQSFMGLGAAWADQLYRQAVTLPVGSPQREELETIASRIQFAVRGEFQQPDQVKPYQPKANYQQLRPNAPVLPSEAEQLQQFFQQARAQSIVGAVDEQLSKAKEGFLAFENGQYLFDVARRMALNEVRVQLDQDQSFKAKYQQLLGKAKEHANPALRASRVQELKQFADRRVNGLATKEVATLVTAITRRLQGESQQRAANAAAMTQQSAPVVPLQRPAQSDPGTPPAHQTMRVDPSFFLRDL